MLSYLYLKKNEKEKYVGFNLLNSEVMLDT